MRLPLIALFLLSLLSGCGSVSGIRPETSTSRASIRDFDRVEVLDFSASATKARDGAEKQAEYDASVEQARREFADKIADAVREGGAFREVSRTAVAPPALRITGDISRYDEGVIAARMLTGVAGQSHFEAVVIFTDAASGRELGRLTVDRNSWPLPVGASTTVLQTPNFFMNGAAKKVASELADMKQGNASKP